jgi:hypothetical protein
MKTYHRISLGLSALLVAAWLFFLATSSGGGGQARDGFGPDPLTLLLFFSGWLVALVLAHSTLISVVLLSRQAVPAATAWRGLATNGVLWLLMATPWIFPGVASVYKDFVYERQAGTRALRAIEKGSLADFEKYFVQALQEKPQYDFVGQVVDTAESHGRLDVLADLKERGVVVVQAGNENGWIEQMYTAVESDHMAPDVSLKTVQWLIGEAAPYGYTLRTQSHRFSDPQLYHTSYRNPKNPDTQRLLDLLISHGVSIAGCNEEGKFCPLWYTARFQLADAVQFLIAHRAPLDRVEPDYDTTALSEAIDNQNPAIAKMLLDAGAHITTSERQNDIVSACDRATYQPNARATEVISLLTEKKIRMTPDDLKKYRGSYNNDVAACAQPFVSPGRRDVQFTTM